MGTPIHTTWVPIKSRRERFRGLLRDFCFGANFLVFRIGKSLLTKDVLTRIKEKEAIGLHNPIASMVIQNGSGMTK